MGEQPGLGAVYTLTPGFEQRLRVLPADLYSQEFKLNFPFALFRAQRTAAHILSLL